jgi:zinc protease
MVAGIRTMVMTMGVTVTASSATAGPMPTSRPPRTETFELSNGLRVYFEQDHRLPLVALTMAFSAGGSRETPGAYGFAHLFEHLMFTGTKHIDKAQQDTMLYSVGALEDGWTNFDMVDYFAIGPSDQLETLLWLESDRMGFLTEALTPAALEAAKATVLNELNERVGSRAYGRAEQRLFELAFPAPHPYFGFVLGRPADVRSATMAGLIRFFEAYYAPANAVLVVVGDVTPAAVQSLVQRYFGSLPGNRRAIPVPRVPLPHADSAPVREVLEDSVAAHRVTVAWRVPPVFTTAGVDAVFDILAVLLGDLRFGLLPQRLVEEQQLLSNARCEYNRYRLGSLFACDLTLRDGVDAGRAEAAFDRVLRDLANPLPSGEIVAARVAWRAEQLRRQENILERARMLAWYAIVAGDASRAVGDAAAHAEVSSAAVARVVTTHLLGRHRYTVIVKPGQKP